MAQHKESPNKPSEENPKPVEPGEDPSTPKPNPPDGGMATPTPTPSN